MAMRCGLRILLLATLAIAAAVAAGAGSAGPLADARSSSCQITQSRSLEGKVRTDIRFVNRTAGTVKVYWLDYSGKRVYYNTLAAGAVYVQPTWESHPWVILDSSGACIGYVVAPAAEYVIGGSGSPGGAAAALKPTFTAVVCTIAAGAGSSTCTAQVADAGPARSNPPTGIVGFTATAGIVGKSCTLSGTPGSPGIASCTVPYTPPSNLVQGEPPPVEAEYGGDSAFSGSSGGSGYTPASVLGPSTVRVTGEGGIPTDLVNPNPFPVSADEALTVASTNTVMLRGSSTAKPTVIGKASVRLRPFASVARTVRLNAAGRSLLARHNTLSAVLSVTTRAHGKPTKTTTRRIVLKAR